MASSIKLISRAAGRASYSPFEYSVPQTLRSIPRSQCRNVKTSAQTSRRASPILLSRQFQPHPALNTNANAEVNIEHRAFSTTPPRPRSKTMGQLKSRYSNGPFSWKAAVLLVLTGAGMIVYFRHEKARLERKRIAELSKGVGKPKVGGPFVLKDLEGKEFTEQDLRGKYSFVSHFFCHFLLLSACALLFADVIIHLVRFTSDSHTARIFAPMSLTKWPT